MTVSGSKESRPFTEQQNSLSSGIDTATALGMIRILRQVDAQLFSGFDVNPSISESHFLAILASVADRCNSLLTTENPAILITGAGTSGRLAALTSALFNRYLASIGKNQICHYLIAGGPKALIKAQERAEDDANISVADLQSFLETNQPSSLVYIGITCGLSATYVFSQLLSLREREETHLMLMGFNARRHARNVPMTRWGMTIQQSLTELSKLDNFTLLNPCVGPEAIAGSTRMKGGSATKILLDVLLRRMMSISIPLRPFIEQFRVAMDTVYGNARSLSHIVTSAGAALRRGCRVIYIGSGIPGMLGVIDASECPPTFGASFDDVRCFSEGGWAEWGSAHSDISWLNGEGKDYLLSMEALRNLISQGIDGSDVFIFIGFRCLSGVQLEIRRHLDDMLHALCFTIIIGDHNEEDMLSSHAPHLLRQACDHLVPYDELHPFLVQCQSSLVHEDVFSGSGYRLDSSKDVFGLEKPDRERVNNCLLILLPELGTHPELNEFGIFSLKLCLNAITTAGHVIAGKVFTNLMVDLKLSNIKLLDRAFKIVAKIADCSIQDAQHHVLRAIYMREEYPQGLEPGAYVEAATEVSKIVPRALLLALDSSLQISEAQILLDHNPIVRALLMKRAAAKSSEVMKIPGTPPVR